MSTTCAFGEKWELYAYLLVTLFLPLGDQVCVGVVVL